MNEVKVNLLIGGASFKNPPAKDLGKHLIVTKGCGQMIMEPDKTVHVQI